jgi:D-lactate dehydrogenase
MKIAFFSAKSYEKPFFASANADGRHAITYIEAALSPVTAPLAAGHDAVCAFVNDSLSAATLEALAPLGIRVAALRSAGFNHVDLEAADRLGIKVVRVPAYSPHAVAEHAVALILDLNRKIHRAYNRTREGNFSLDGLMGFDLHGLTAGLVGTGKIGLCVARILKGFGMEVIAADPAPTEEGAALGIRFLPLEEVLGRSDVLSLHCPLTPRTRHLIDAEAVALMKRGAMLINTSRGAVVDTRALIAGLKTGKIGSVGLDVYEEEENLFFRDLSAEVIQDDVFSRLLTFPNVVVTGHQAFFTRDAMQAIAGVTVGNLDELERTGTCANEVSVEAYAPVK